MRLSSQKTSAPVNIILPSVVKIVSLFDFQMQIMFNKSVNKCFADYKCAEALTAYQGEMIESLDQLAELVSTNLISYKRLSVEALLTIQVHNRDIISSLIKSGITSKSDFEWLR